MLAIGVRLNGQTHVLEFEHRVDRLAGQHFGRVLIDEVVATLDGVEHVPLPVVFFDIAQRGGDAALRGAGVRARRIEFADDGDIGLARHLDRGHQSRAASPDDDRIKSVICHGESSFNDPSSLRLLPSEPGEGVGSESHPPQPNLDAHLWGVKRRWSRAPPVAYPAKSRPENAERYPLYCTASSWP